MNLEKLYFRLPYRLQYLILNLRGYLISRNRFNQRFQIELSRFRESDREVLNIEMLKTFMVHSKKSPFWRERFEKHKVDVDSDNLLEEIKKLPILTKEEVKKNIETIKITDLEERVINVQTSGTTGSGMVFPMTRTMEARQWAVWWRYRNEHGIDFKERCAWFGGRSILNIDRKKPPFWIHNRPMHQIMFSAHHLNEKTVPYYFEKIKSEKIKWIHGYPSQIAYFANLVEKKRLGNLPDIKIITFGAENLLQHQIEQIKRVLGNIKLVQHYGLAEGVSNISENSERELIADQDFAFTEFVKSGQKDNYKIIGTGYSNLAFPLIRYFTGDNASLSFENDKMVIDSIDGRNEDYITLPNGVKLGRLDHIFKSFRHISEAQILQTTLDGITVRIVKTDTYRSSDEKKLFEELNKRFGKDVTINLEYCEAIERTASGKFKFVISDV